MPLCNSSLENGFHLLVFCPLARKAWTALGYDIQWA